MNKHISYICRTPILNNVCWLCGKDHKSKYCVKWRKNTERRCIICYKSFGFPTNCCGQQVCRYCINKWYKSNNFNCLVCRSKLFKSRFF